MWRKKPGFQSADCCLVLLRHEWKQSEKTQGGTSISQQQLTTNHQKYFSESVFATAMADVNFLITCIACLLFFCQYLRTSFKITLNSRLEWLAAYMVILLRWLTMYLGLLNYCSRGLLRSSPFDRIAEPWPGRSGLGLVTGLREIHLTRQEASAVVLNKTNYSHLHWTKRCLLNRYRIYLSLLQNIRHSIQVYRNGSILSSLAAPRSKYISKYRHNLKPLTLLCLPHVSALCGTHAPSGSLKRRDTSHPGEWETPG